MNHPIIQNIWIGKPPKLFDGGSVDGESSYIPMNTRHPLRDKSPQAERLRQLREAMGFTASNEFAEWLGITAQRWNNFENGYPLSRDVGKRLTQQIPGLTLDWLEIGYAAGLSFDMVQRLGIGERSKPPPNGPQHRSR
jgi:hypothetical protein